MAWRSVWPAAPTTAASTKTLLHQQIVAPASDFRAGFDGVLGGYLMLTGPKGLELLESRYFANPKAAIGDVQHAMRALRFYHQFGHGIEPIHEAEVLAHVLDRPEFAADGDHRSCPLAVLANRRPRGRSL